MFNKISVQVSTEKMALGSLHGFAFGLIVSLYCCPALAQDMRPVNEPAVPAVCTSLAASTVSNKANLLRTLSSNLRLREFSDPVVEKIFLGRPWRTYSTVVSLESELDQKTDPAGWQEWHAEETHRRESAFYAEYRSQAPGANPAARERYSKQLSESEAQKYRIPGFLSGSDGRDHRIK